ncbi:MAG: endopeptidase La [Candidatus Marinimicrobia bacterium]|jgi:ATP-dependent Lon protease|nr:endopeptidase La [Candidatus Neomarinimicrobiota bacterium]MDP6569585.1 endopeptidase La [Candidatus Neomarinimicrobiota bacterium]MDP7025672.1 endopeptidase La [Candidatus Neomarinimicrobiota bacterium]|tara:strand:- start:531 stop:2915 length:2385 start_codon:yes stop_codon:yes gene_type:complete
MTDEIKDPEILEEDSLEDAAKDVDSYPVMPLRNTVLFPQQVIPTYIGRERSLQLIDDLPKGKKLLVVVAQEDGSMENPEPDDLYAWGTLAVVLKVFDMPDNSKSAIIQGLDRVKLQSFTQQDPYFKAVVERVEDDEEEDIEIEALASTVRNSFQELVKIAPYLTDEHSGILTNITKLGRLADRVISLVTIPTKEKQDILEELNVKERMDKTTVLLNREIQRIELGEKIQSDVQDEISKTQREYFLREQMKAIKKELGDDDGSAELNELEEKIKAAGMSEEAEEVAMKEIDRLTRIPPQSPEYSVSRTYLDWLIDLPWSVTTEDRVDTVEAKRILDEDHYGLDDVKERIIEYLAVRKLKEKISDDGKVKGPILCFAGPPGVGKTSLGRSIARSMGREFVRISLGGVRDEAEIRGHRRTYIGALPGRIIQSLKKAGSNNPVFMLDEVDKVGADFRGDPSSALLEVLDPEQNFSFSDHYLEVPFDLSNVMFIATANLKDPIIPALKDRMEILDFTGYVEEEKIQIAKRFLVPKQLEENGLNDDDLNFTQGGIKELLKSYTREAGVRNLDREIGNICRKVAREKVEGKTEATKVTKAGVLKYLGVQRFFSETTDRLSKPGVVVGLAWTSAGGDILFIEANKMVGKGKLTLTGHLGDVMKESAQAALSYVRANAEKLGVDPKFHESTDIHIHVPAGAIPKDGPSAGITIFTAIYSLLTDRAVKHTVAMTGEITLRGAVLPIGGVREKVTAAHRAGLREIILPHENERNLEKIPSKILKDMKFHFVKEISDVVDYAFPKK